MIASELLDILVCPETKQELSLMSEAEVAAVNERIRNGSLENRGGDRVSEEIAGLLLRKDGAYAYMIRDGIPIMLIEEAIEMSW